MAGSKKMPLEQAVDLILRQELKRHNVNHDPGYSDYVDDSYTDVLKSVIAVTKRIR